MLVCLQLLVVAECYGLAALPSGIGHLQKLEGLILEECSSLQTLPAGLGQLLKLKTLNLEECVQLQVGCRLQCTSGFTTGFTLGFVQGFLCLAAVVQTDVCGILGFQFIRASAQTCQACYVKCEDL